MATTITIDRQYVKIGETAEIRFTFTNPNYSLSLEGLTVTTLIGETTGGTVHSLVNRGVINGQRVYTATFTPTANLQRSIYRLTYDVAGKADDAISENFAVDTVRPTLESASIAKSDLRLGEKTTITITFSERLAFYDNFTLEDLQVDAGKGTLSNLRSYFSDQERIWHVDLQAPTTRPASGLDGNQIRINLAGITDRAGNTIWDSQLHGTGNPWVNLPTVSYNIDNGVPPMVAITGQPATTIKGGDSFTVTFTFNERVTGFDLDDVQYDTSKGTLSALTAVGTDGRVWTATYTPRPNIESAENTISVNLAGVRDALGNAGVGTGTSGNFSIDTKPPEVAVTISDERLTAGESATVTFTFSERVTGFDLNDAQYDTSKGTLGALTAVGTDGKVWTATYTPRSDIESANNTIRVNLAGVQDAQGNAGVGTGSSGNFVIDTRPTVVDGRPSIVSVVGPTSIVLEDTDVTITFTFSEAVTGFTLANINLDNSSASPYITYSPKEPVSADGGRTWTITFRAAPRTTDSTNTVSIRNLDGVRDLAGNLAVPNSSASTDNYEVDTEDPDPISATFDKTHLAAGETATVTVTFNEIVNNVTQGTFDIPNGSVSNLRQDPTDGRIWRATFTPTANLQSASSLISINLNDLRDSAGNVSSGRKTFYDSTIVIDTKPPEVAVTISDERLTAGESATVTFTFSERVTGFDLNDVQYDTSKGTLSALTAVGTDGKVWSATYTPRPDIESAENTIRVNLAGVQDAQGNAGVGTGSSGNFVIDTRPPVVDGRPSIVSVVGPTSIVLEDTDVTITFTFSEAVTGFTLANINLDNSSASPYITYSPKEPVSADGGRTWTITYRAAPRTTDSTNTVSIRNLDGVRDLAGNLAVPNSSASTDNYEVDTEDPDPISATFDKTHLAAGETATVTVTFNEIVNNVTEDSFQIPNGSVSNLRQDTTDGRIWRVTFTPTANLQSASSLISINLNDLRDSAGNVSSGRKSFYDSTIVIDTKRPEVTVVISDNRLTAGETATVTFTFSERVTGFDLNDVQYDTSKGTLGALTAVGTDGKVWTATYTPRPNIESADNTIRVNLAGVQDAQGNAGEGSVSSGNFSIDTRPPEVDRPPEVTVTISDNRLTAGESATVTFTFSKSVTGFTKDDIDLTLANGTLGDLVPVGTDGKVWSATFTPRPDTESADNTIRVNLAGVLDAQGNAGVGTGTSGNFTIDTKRPEVAVAISDERLTAGETATVTFTFTERVTGFDLNDVQYDTSKGTLGALTAVGTDGKVWSATYTPRPDTESATNTIRVNLAGVLDALGNAGVGTGSSGNFVIDTRPTVVDRPPSATIAVTPNPVTNSNDRLVTVTITFDEAVTGFTADNIDFSNAHVTPYGRNRIGALNSSADGRTYTITYTAEPDVEDATNTISLRNLHTIRDATGNAVAVSPTSNNFAIDTKAPVPISATFDKTHLAAGETATVTVIFNEIVNNVTEDTFQIPNGSVSNLRQDTTDGRIWRATFTPTANLQSTSSSISINLDGLRDSAGNVNNGSLPFRDSTIVIDTKRPEVTVAISDERLTAGETATVTFTFSERVTGFDLNDVQYDTSKGTLGALTAVGTDGKVWTATYTPRPNTESADNTIRVNLAGVQDAQGNAGAGSVSSGNFSIDTKRPEVTVTISDNRLAAGQTATVTFTFNERVTGFDLNDVQYDTSKGTLGALTAVGTDGKVWSATYTPRSDIESADNTIRVNLAGVLDAQGNAGTGSVSSGNFSIDTKRPEVTVTISDERLSAGETATVTFTFRESVTGFGTEDIQYDTSKGTLSALTAVGTDGKVWSATYTPRPNIESADNTIRVNLAGVQDAQGNAGTGSASSGNFSIDTKPPEVTVTISDERLSAGQTATVTFTFTERVTGFGTEDIQYDTSKGTLGALTAVGTDGKVWSATYTPRSDIESAENTIRVNLAGVLDAQGNAGTGSASSGNFSIDTRPPEVTVTISDNRLSAGQTATVTFTFNERVTGFDLNDVQYDTSKGTLGALTAVGTDGKVWTATYTPRPDTESADNTIRVNLAGVLDAQGNAGTGSVSSGNFSIDTKPPEVTVTISDNRLSAGQTATVTFTFNERVTGFDLNDVQYDTSKGTLGALTAVGTDGKVWTATYTPRPDIESADNTIRVNLSGVLDAQGNAGTGSVSSGNFSIDTKRPEVTVTISDNRLSAGQTATFTFTFNERVTGFDLNDVQYDTSKGTLGALTAVGTDGKVWSATYTPRPDTESADNTIRVNLAGVLDAQGNAGTGSVSSGNFSIDTKRPEVTVTISDNRLSAGQTATFTFTFSERVTGFDLNDVQYDTSKGTLGALTAVGTDGKVWTATYTPRPDTESADNTIRVNLAGVLDAQGNAGTGSVSSGNFSIDTKRPEVTVTISDERLSAGETATVTFTFRESVTGFGTEDIQYDTSKGTLGALTAVGTDGKVWTATYTPRSNIESADNTIRVNLAGVLDAQGNAGTGSVSSGNFSIDTKRPEVTVTISDNRLSAGQTATFTFTFSERVTGFDLNDVQYDTSKGTLGALTAVGTDGKVWSATYTPRSDIESADNTIRVNLAGVLDAQGNAGTGSVSSGNFSIDTKPPEVTVTISDERLSAGETATVTFTFTERVTGFGTEDIQYDTSKGTLSALTAVGTDGKVWSATYTPRPNIESADNTIRVNLAGVQDAQGNAGTGSASSGNFSIDTKPPEVTVTISDERLAAGETATVTFTFNERVTGFGTEDIQYDTSKGTLGALTAVGTDGKVWSTTYTPRPNIESADNTIRVNLAGVQDAQGNAGTGSASSGNFSIDTRPPEVTVTISDERLSAGETATVTFTFTERVTGFGTEDIQYDTSKGTLGALTAVGTDGKVWTATYTPRPDIESADNTIRVNLSGVLDAQGNAGVGTGTSGNFSIDTKRPEVTVTISDNRLIAGQTATFTFTFSERVTGFDLNDVQYDTSKGTLGALTAVGTDGKVWSATYTPRPNIESADNTIRVNLAGVLDAQGNAGTGSVSSGNFSIDTKRPEVTVTISDERLSAGETATVTFTFRESVTDFGSEDIQYDTSKGTLGALTAVGTDGKVWTATYTPRPNIESADNTIRVNLAGVLDAQGNAGTGSASSGNFSIDTRPPEVTVTISDERLSAGETATVTFTFRESVTGFGTEDIQYDTSKGTLSALTAVGTDGKVWSATYTPRPDTESADNTIRVNLAGVLDAQGNAGTGSVSSGNFSIDTKRPEVTVTISDNRLSAGQTATFTFTFSERVTGFDLNDVQYDTSKGTLGALTAVGTDGKVWSATYTPRSDTESADNTIRVNLAGVQDAQGNAGTGSASSGNFSIDTKRPEVTVAISDERLSAGETATVTFTFRESVTGFDLNDVQYDTSKGTLSALTAVGTDGKVWSATYTPRPNIESADNTIRVNLAGVQDAQGNAGTGSVSSGNFSIDTRPPEVTVTISDERLSAGQTATVTFTFSERVTGFGTEDIQYDTSKGTLSALTAVGTDGKVWSATYTPRPDTESATNTIRVNLAGVQDAQGNAGTGSASSGNFSIDTKRPEVTVTISDERLAAGQTATVTFTFNERVTGFDLNDVQYDTSKGTLGALTAVGTDGKVWSATYTPRPNIESADNTIRVNLAGVQDAQGNAGTGSVSSGNFSIDTKRPEVTVTISDERLSAGETATVTFTFRESVTGFGTEDIQYDTSKGTLSALTAVGTDGKVWTATYTPRPNIESADNTIRVNLAGVQDAQGNAGTGSASSGNFSIDTRPPEVTVTISDERLSAGETATVTFTFTERVTGFGTEDIQYDTSKGTLSALTAVGTDGKVWTATYTPRPNIESADNTIRVNLAGVLDAQGNAGTGSVSSGNFSIDTKRPEVTVTISDERLSAGETATVTFTFSESVTGFGTEDIQYDTSKGTLGALTAVGTDGKVWTATYTPRSNIESADNTIRVNLAGVQDAQGNAGTGSASSGNFSIDTKPPEVTVTISDERLSAGETATVTFTFTERVTGFGTEDIQYDTSKGTLGALTAVGTDGKVWSATYTPRPDTESADNTIRVNLSGVLDAQGNAGTGSVSSGNFSIDTKRPEVTVTISDNRLSAGQTATVTFTFNERVTGFDLNDVQYDTSKGTLGALTAVGTDGKVWTATYTPRPDTESADNTIRVNLAGVLDAQGNAGTGSVSSGNFSIDTKRPEVTVAISDNRLIAGQTATVTFTFRESVTGFDLNDVQYDTSKGTLGALTAVGTDGKVWSATYTPRPDTESAENTISVNLAGVRDALGNAGVGTGTSGNFSIDTKPPEVAVTISDNRLTAGESATITFTFNERVTGFDLDDVQYDTSKGTLGALTPVGTDGRVWSASYTPRPGIESADNAISVRLAGVRDALGNAGVGTGTSGNFTIDTKPPEVTVTISDNRLTAGESATVTFTFSESVTGFTKEAIDLSQANGTLGDLVPVGTDGKVWTATFTPTDRLARTTNHRLTLNLTNVRDAAGNAPAVNTYSFNQYTVDTMVFALSNATVNRNQLVLFYSDETALDPDQTHNAPNDAFVVLVDGVRNNVTGVVVDAAAKTVTLTLERAVSHGQQVTVAYNDPSTGDDPQAVQEAGSGDDAASFAARPVTNLSPRAPATGTTDADSRKSSEDSDGDTANALDSDYDSVPNAQEDQAPGLLRPDGSAGTDGDGNGDGIRDSQQVAVGSTRDLTLVAGSQDGKLIPGSNARISELVRKDAPASLPKGMEMPLSLTQFRVGLSEGRYTESFSLYVDPALGVNGYWVKDSAGTWVNLASEPYGGKMSTEGGRTRLDFQIQDGGQYDTDGLADGHITALGAAAKMPLSIVGQAPPQVESHRGFWF
ncbi:Ig-like domain-containing protein [Verminephrobacter eiseniae]|nr:Ig-like domain-containing protein [Verminephrobacter eiseniae]